jgi:nitrogen fixation protein FixH
MLDIGPPKEPHPTPAREPFCLTGKHVLAFFIAFFGVVFVVNFYMAHLATSTFSGEVVENSYVASQRFNRWLDEAAREKALGWQIRTTRRGDGRVVVAVAGPRPGEAVLNATARRPLGAGIDQPLRFAAEPGVGFVSSEALPAGRWLLRLEVKAAGRQWHGEQAI